MTGDLACPEGAAQGEPLPPFPLPLRAHGPRAWYRVGLRPGQELRLARESGEVLGRVRAEGVGGGKLFGLLPYHNGTRLILEHWIGEDSWRMVCQLESEGLVTGRFSRDQDGQSHEFGSVHFGGIKAELRGSVIHGSVDRPDPLRAGWRFWETGAERAETSLHGQQEVQIDPRGGTTTLAAELLMAWLLGMVLTEAASD